MWSGVTVLFMYLSYFILIIFFAQRITTCKIEWYQQSECQNFFTII